MISQVNIPSIHDLGKVVPFNLAKNWSKVNPVVRIMLDATPNFESVKGAWNIFTAYALLPFEYTAEGTDILAVYTPTREVTISLDPQGRYWVACASIGWTDGKPYYTASVKGFVRLYATAPSDGLKRFFIDCFNPPLPHIAF